MAKPITVSINVTRLLREHIYPGKNGKYLSLALFPNKDGPDQYGNTHYACQDVNKEAREKGIKGPICGNARVPVEEEPRRPAPKPKAPSKPDPELDPEDPDSEIPF